MILPFTTDKKYILFLLFIVIALSIFYFVCLYLKRIKLKIFAYSGVVSCFESRIQNVNAIVSSLFSAALHLIISIENIYIMEIIEISIFFHISYRFKVNVGESWKFS